ncbi:response regulator [Metabacillus indicus]|uniref:response regulator transcription factor n=1 Tax=Metabacillus indicus TaxID=246786 RepID=UPI00316F1716
MYNLLIVDDERLVVETLALTIPWSSIQIKDVYTANSAADALKIMNTQTIDIVLTDIRMPEISGLELIEKIRSFNKKTKCVIYSGYSDFKYAQKAMTSSVVEYLLKPASDEEILQSIEKATNILDEEWNEVVSTQRAKTTLMKLSPLLQSTFLLDIINGKRLSQFEINHHVNLLKLPFQPQDKCALIVVRLEEDSVQTDWESLSLLDLAVNNIAEETLREHFSILSCKDSYDYLVYLVKLNDQKADQLCELGDMTDKMAMNLIEQSAIKLQDNAKKFLKKDISMVVSKWGEFPNNAASLYQDCITSFRRSVGNDKGIFLTLDKKKATDAIESLQSLYEPPTLMQLLDMGNRAATMNKISEIIQELEKEGRSSQEHLLEAFLNISAAFTYAIHKNGKNLDEILGEKLELLINRKSLINVKQLNDWSTYIAIKLFEELDTNLKNSKEHVIVKVQKFIYEHLSEDVSLQAIADHVFLHPAYLSTIFKAETGENLRDYVIRLKMEKASYLLKHTNERIYQICNLIGYQNPPYFIKIFKKFYGVTPQEYRESSLS